jgi:citrate lyase gamma subunit
MKLLINGQTIEVDNETVKGALESEDSSIEVKAENLVIRSSEDDEKFQNNLKQQSQAIGIEIGRKNILKSLEIEAEGAHKSDDKALEALTGYVQSSVSKAMEDAKIEPNKKVAELTKDLDTLRNTIKEKENAFSSLQEQFTGYKKNQTINSTLSSLIPDNTVIPKSDMMTILSNKIKVDVDESGKIIALGDDGQPMKDKTTLEPLPIDNVVKGFFDNNPTYLKPVDGGAGGGDSSPGGSGKQSLEQFTERMQKEGIKLNSPEFVEKMNAEIKAGTLEV